ELDESRPQLLERLAQAGCVACRPRGAIASVGPEAELLGVVSPTFGDRYPRDLPKAGQFARIHSYIPGAPRRLHIQPRSQPVVEGAEREPRDRQDDDCIEKAAPGERARPHHGREVEPVEKAVHPRQRGLWRQWPDERAGEIEDCDRDGKRGSGAKRGHGEISRNEVGIRARTPSAIAALSSMRFDGWAIVSQLTIVPAPARLRSSNAAPAKIA